MATPPFQWLRSNTLESTLIPVDVIPSHAPSSPLGNLVSSTIRRSQTPDTSLHLSLTILAQAIVVSCLDHCHPLLTGFLLLPLFFLQSVLNVSSSCVLWDTRQTSSASAPSPRHPGCCPAQRNPGRHHGPRRLPLTSRAPSPHAHSPCSRSAVLNKQARCLLQVLAQLMPLPGMLFTSKTARCLTRAPASASHS